ncbi:tRNA dimethylallyltransferase [Sphingomonas japonica]|uniref:tRNA dimethylallyltransferase n=2 Tax=Sphingomonas japonica TaxID=511662 RepID=A0ABX0U4V8_9SPHN|nr:tRNA (adenosine(37)-N6)-dimethylallyltransferase MiaA [Sphingomonas japonica]NIJ24327.1 tRNA dimethylallyltransferase [Sphingomonas japonica]
MAKFPQRLPLVVIAGPTASGKSALGLAFAEKHAGTVINADSAQVYRNLRVVTARPSPDEEARAPHRLFGHVDGAEAYSAPRWASEATATIARIHADGGVPVLVGGTGMYLRTLLDGIAPVPEIDPEIRAQVRALAVGDAHAALAREDPAAAARLLATDTTRVARALEVVRATGRPLVDWQRERVGGIADRVRLVPLILLPDRAWLMQRCDARFDAMLAEGAIDEVRALAARSDIPASAPVRRAIGVPELTGMIGGTMDRAEAVARAKAATRHYAKRQYTWFRNQPPFDWPRLHAHDPTERTVILESCYNSCR